VAEQKAQEAAQFSLQNLPRQAVAGGAGALEGVFGIESILANAARKVSKGTGAPSLDAPTYRKAVGLSVLGEAIPEAVQAAVGQVGTNAALNQAGISKDLTTRLKSIITSIDGDTNKTSIIHFVDNELFAQDSRALREHIKTISPGIDFNMDFTCQECLYEGKLNLPVGVDFFWPGA
jgi:hypothetical protein